MRLHNLGAVLKGNRLMVQRKGDLPVKDSRSSEKRAKEDLDITTASSMVRVPTALPALGDLPPYSAEGAGGGEPEPVSPSQTHQGTKFGGEKAPTWEGNTLCEEFQWE